MAQGMPRRQSGRQMPPYYLKILPVHQPSPNTREMLINYARLRPEEVDAHLFNIREKAWDIGPAPWIGSWSFLTTRIDQIEGYQQLLERLKSDLNKFKAADDASSGASPCQILDAGTGLGQDLRRLVHDRVPSSRIFACDVEPRLWNLSLDLWRDEAYLRPTSSRFRQIDLTQSSSSDTGGQSLDSWDGAFDFIFAGHLLDEFDYGKSITVATSLAKLTRGPGSEILAWQRGGSGEEVSPDLSIGVGTGFETESKERDAQKKIFLANEESLTHIWQVEVLQRTGLRFEIVKVSTKENNSTGAASNPSAKWFPQATNILECWLRRL